MKYVLLGHRRTGTNLLRQSLNLHPDVMCKGELFNLTKRWSKVLVDTSTIVNYGFRSTKAANGFSLHYHHAQKPYLDCVSKSKKYPVIRIIRRNLLERYVSQKIAEITGVYRSTVFVDASIKIKIDLNDMLNNFHKIKTDLTFLPENYIDIFYEDLCSNYDFNMGIIFDFLKVPSCIVRPNLCKIESRPMSEVIINYDEVASYQEFI
jgi:hypothetical protein